MNGEARESLSGAIAKAFAAAMLIVLAGCGDGPGRPGPPQGPPRPVTSDAFVTTAHFSLPSRPVAPRPGMM